MGKNRLREIVFRCIDEESSKRPCAEDLIRMLRLQSSPIVQKKMNATTINLPTIQLLVLGAINVGKSSLISRYLDDIFNCRILVTIGKDIRVARISVRDRDFKLQIVDTAGQEKFLSALGTSEFRKSQGIVIVYDVTDPNSLYHGVKIIYKLIKEKALDDVSLILVGNKAGESLQSISEEEGKRYARTLNIPHIQTNAKTGKNVNEMFEMIIEEIDKSLDLSAIYLQFKSQQTSETIRLPQAGKRTGAGKPRGGATPTGGAPSGYCCKWR